MYNKRIVALSGGLGNQMFQYAFARMLEITKNCDVEFDIGFYAVSHVRTVEIDKYSINKYEFKEHPVFNRIRLAFQRRPFLAWTVGVYKEYSQFQIDPRVFKYNYRFYCGYWQNKDYLELIREKLHNEFRFKGSITIDEMNLIKEIEDGYSVAIHIRRGDYLERDNKRLYHPVSEAYYRKAIERACSEIGNTNVSNIRIYFFSDDIEWCKICFADLPNALFVDNSISSSQHVDMIMMEKARCLITANSSFSWWAAWLSDRDDKIVIVPDKWYCDNKINDKALRALVCDNWIVIKS